MKMLFICASRISKYSRFFFVIISYIGITSYADVSLEIKPLDATHYNLKLDFDIDEYDGIYEQYLSISIDDPDIVLSKVACSVEPILQYVSTFKSSKSLYLGSCNFSATINALSADHLKTAHLYVTYRLLRQKYSKTIIFPLSSALPCKQDSEIQTSIDTSQTITQLPLEKKSKKNASPPASMDSESILFAPEQTTPPLISLGILSLLCMIIGLFLLFKGSYAKRKSWRPIAATLGMALIASSILVAAKAYQAQYQGSDSTSYSAYKHFK